MDKRIKKSIEEAKRYIKRIKDTSHDVVHVKAVTQYSVEISREFPEVNPDIIEVAAWWHDVGRLHEEVHEEISAKMAYDSLSKNNLPEKICKKIYDAIVSHKWSMKPKTIEGEIIRDADKLDFITLERWKHCIKEKNFVTLNNLAKLLPRLRNEFLHLDISRKIYDKRIKNFISFIKTVNQSEFREIKEKILAYNL